MRFHKNHINNYSIIISKAFYNRWEKNMLTAKYIFWGDNMFRSIMYWHESKIPSTIIEKKIIKNNEGNIKYLNHGTCQLFDKNGTLMMESHWEDGMKISTIK